MTLSTYFLYFFLFFGVMGLSALFVAAEYALTSLEVSEIKNIHPRHIRDKCVLYLINKSLGKLSYSLSAVQLGITLTAIISGILAPKVIGSPIIAGLKYSGYTPSSVVMITINILSIIVTTSITMVYGELVPKNFAILSPITAARVTIIVLWVFAFLFYPLIWLFDSFSWKILRVLGFSEVNHKAARSVEELAAIVAVATDTPLSKDLSSNAHTQLHRVVYRSLQFGERSAEELMTPRSKVETIDKNASVFDLITLAIETGHSRFPVTDGDFDETIGAVHVKQVMALSDNLLNQVKVGQLCRNISKVPASLTGDEVMDILRNNSMRIALVVDEYGGNAGIVTFEDLIEEIVGEVHDEYDPAENRIVQIGESYNVSGLLRLDEIAEEINFFPCEGDYETIGGAVMTLMGKIPQIGDTVLIPDQRIITMDDEEESEENYFTWRAEVIDMDGLRVDTLTLTPVSHLMENTSDCNENIADNKDSTMSYSTEHTDSYDNACKGIV